MPILYFLLCEGKEASVHQRKGWWRCWNIPSSELATKIKKKAGKLLIDINVFDLYEGKNIDANKKSLAYSLTFGDSNRTLTDDEIVAVMDKVIADLEKDGMELRK